MFPKALEKNITDKINVPTIKTSGFIGVLYLTNFLKKDKNIIKKNNTMPKKLKK